MPDRLQIGGALGCLFPGLEPIVGSAIGLLIYFWKDWVEIVRAFFATLRKRRIETSTEKLAWLIIVASIPVGIFGIALEHTARTATAKPLIASASPSNACSFGLRRAGCGSRAKMRMVGRCFASTSLRR